MSSCLHSLISEGPSRCAVFEWENNGGQNSGRSLDTPVFIIIIPSRSDAGEAEEKKETSWLLIETQGAETGAYVFCV